MAWNEPGGGKDPWSGKGGNDGPPDLDEALKKLRDNLGNLFGGDGGRRSSSEEGKGGGPGRFGIGLIAGVLVVGWLFSGFYTVEPAERGVVLRFGEYQDVTMPGLRWHLPAPMETVIKVNVDEVASFRHKAQMLTKDENIVDVELTVQSRIQDSVDFLFQDHNPKETLQNATETAVREVIGKNNLDYILTEGRSAVADLIRKRVQELVDSYRTGLIVASINMQPAKPPEAVKAAFDDAIKAREDQVRTINQAEAYANEVVPKARGLKARRIEDANAYHDRVIAEAEGDTARFLSVLHEYEKAPEVTRERLYLETLEEVLGKTQKVVVDVEGGNNLLYLPLDRMIGEKVVRPSTDSTPTLEMPPSSQPAESVEREVNRTRRSR